MSQKAEAISGDCRRWSLVEKAVWYGSMFKKESGWLIWPSNRAFLPARSHAGPNKGVNLEALPEFVPTGISEEIRRYVDDCMSGG